MIEPAISVTGLTKRFDGRTVVDNLSLEVGTGEIRGFLGPNGSGKTTTLRMICGLLTLDGGAGRVLGHDIRTAPGAIKRQIGYMTQRFSSYDDLNIEENLRFVAGLYGLRPARQIVRDTLEDFGLASRKHQLAGTLSGGWKQRLALAACVMHRPHLLLLDEPTAGVDPKARREFWNEIHQLAAQAITVLVSTHYMDEAERCHKISYIANGRMIAQGTVDEVALVSALKTYLFRGPRMAEAAQILAANRHVEQVASFASTLHVVGRDSDQFRHAVAAAAAATGASIEVIDTSLEDIFIHLMREAGTR
ncbi:ABC transporter ATP-binding protein [Limimaricola sp. G21655-S1]|uniref:ABC transporter ATP-binding protein n=1 Tax=Limimaricola sp. G21655-S1 TaxID=3014768 RepID=UPI0022AE6FF9|nr:ABC transporter ATP-binding protein [Limimaricola sp. G21655-S1]MCZ4262238.1 ABC transporter ATP-binding protein [Limimaricola sp. G21655-S1]